MTFVIIYSDQNVEIMDNWKLTVLGGTGVGKTALLVQVCSLSRLTFSSQLTFIFFSLL